MAQLRVTKIPASELPVQDPEGRAMQNWLKDYFEGLLNDPDAGHAAIIAAVPEMGSLPGNVHLVRTPRRRGKRRLKL